MIEYSGKRFLSRLYIHPIDALPKSTFNGKIKVSVRKMAAAFGSASGVAMDIAQYADRKLEVCLVNPFSTRIFMIYY